VLGYESADELIGRKMHDLVHHSDWAGLEDQNVTAEHTMAFYNALRRNRKQVIALFYKGEGHSLLQEQAQVDLTCRVLNWFGYFLKRNGEGGWIDEGMNKKDAQ
jgi:hypothetical protein